MSHRNSDNNTSWGSRSSRNNDSGGAGGGYKDRSWSGNRYGSDSRYNNNNKDRRNYRSYGSRNERRTYDERRGNSYRNSSWTSNVGMDSAYMSHSRHQKNWHQNRKSDKGNTYDAQIAPPNPQVHEFSDPEEGEIIATDTEQIAVPTNGGHDDQNCEPAAETSINVEKNVNHTSLSDEFQGFPEINPPKASNGTNADKDIDLSIKSPLVDNKLEIIPQENELIKLIEDEALRMISDAEQPSCSSSLQNVTLESVTPATVSANAAQNPERRSTIERSAEQVTRKLINQLTTMNKYSLKQMINNPDSKYESALKTHARQKLRAEVRRQLRNFSLSESSAQTKTTCGMLEPDECVDSDKIPDALLEQIGKVLDLNLLDLNVGEEQPAIATAGPVEDDDCVINPSDVDYSAAEVLDKNLRLNDDDGQLNLDAEDIFARAEMLLMKGSEAGLQGSSSGPSSPTDEMFPNDQIDSIVSEESGYDKTLDLNGCPNGDNKDDSLKEDPTANAEFTCFLRVSTVEELNKKVDDVPVSVEEETPCPLPISNPPTASSSEVENVIDTVVVSEPAKYQPQEISPEQLLQESSFTKTTLTAEVPEKMETEAIVQELVTPVDSLSEPPLHDLPNVCTTDEPLAETITPQNEPSKQPSIPEVPCSVADSVPKEEASEMTTNITQAPIQPELVTRKTKSSKTYKPNLVQHEQQKRDSKSSNMPRSSSNAPTSASSNINSSSVTNKPYKPGPNLAALKQTGKCSSGSNKGTVADDSNKDKNQKKRESNNPGGSRTSPSKNTGLIMLAEEMQQFSSFSSVSALKPVSTRPKTPGPMATPPEQFETDKQKKKKKKRSRNRKSFTEDVGMMLECDLRVTRPVVTATPPPVPRDSAPASSSKKTSEPERESKPLRETRARSVDPKMISDSKREKEKERDRNREKSRNREADEKKESERDAKKEKAKEDHRREKDKEVKKEKDNDKGKEKEKEITPTVDDCPNKNSTIQQTELLTVKPERERKKSPAPAKPGSRSSVDTNKNSKETKELKENAKESPKEPLPVEEKEKEINPESSKEKDPRKGKETKESKENNKDKDKEHTDNNSKDMDTRENCKEKDPVEKDFKNESTDKSKDKDSDGIDGCSESEVKKPQKKKRNLLRGPNLLKGRREVPTEAVIDPQKNGEETPVPEQTSSVLPNLPPAPVSGETIAPENTSNNFPIHKVRRDVVITESIDPIPALRSTVSSLIHRTASPRPWKSPGEKKLIPDAPLITAPTATVTPMSPPQTERHQIACSATASTTLAIETQQTSQHHHHHYHQQSQPQQQQNIPCVTPPVVAQPDVLARIGLPTTTLGSAQMINFEPVMTLLNQMQDIDNKMGDYQRRKMQIDSEIMRLNSEKFQIEQNSMQLQNDRFMALNALRAALVECELSALAAAQSAAVIAPVVPSNRRRHLTPETEDLPRNKRRKTVETVTGPSTSTAAVQVSCPELSEPEEPSSSTQPSATSNNSERTIRRITKISDNTQILKLFQRRRLVSEKSAEESQSEDSVIPSVEPPVPAKRRRTRTVHVVEPAEPVISTLPTGRLRSDVNRSVDPKKSVDVPAPTEQSASVASPPNIPAPSTSAKLKKDEEIPLNVHKNLLTRQVKIVLSKLDVAGRRGTT
ncbi:titin homolog isoform X2 [Wyeomyia smithii]|uniref:titin homolog isoform X2 n=1 Tax=Wyeomyia smithii TaxID=174621 RepID=UPI002467D76E|nr:titin homolog isoform X2 [Wyeomyia smithii]